MKKQGDYPSGMLVTMAVLDIIIVMFFECLLGKHCPTYLITYNLIQSS